MKHIDAVSSLSAEDRARLTAMMAERYPEYAAAAKEDAARRVGPFRRFMRWVLGLTCLGIIGVVAWHAGAVTLLPQGAAGALMVPLPLPVGAGVLAIILLLWFDARLLWTPLFLLGLALIGAAGISMRWIDSAPGGIREHWAGIELQNVKLSGDLCYRIDDARFVLRGANGRVFAYQRLVWPGSFSEPEFRRYFFSDAPMQVRVDGWTCVVRG